MMMCSSGVELSASPGCNDSPGIVCETDVLYGANSLVTRPGAGSPHAHETKPEQSDRYGFHDALSSRLHTDEHALS